MKKCKYCGKKMFSTRRLKKHMKECQHGQSKAGASKGQEVKEELAEAQVSEEPVEAEIEEIADEGIGYEEMTVLELRRLARVEGVTGIYSKNKAELIKTLKEGEK